MIPLFAQQVYPAPGLAYIISSKVNGTKIKWEQKKKASPRWVTLTPNPILKTAVLREMTAKNKKHLTVILCVKHFRKRCFSYKLILSTREHFTLTVKYAC